MLGNVQTHLESTEQVKDPWHSEEIVCGLGKMKPPLSSRTVPWAGKSPDQCPGLYRLLRDAVVATEAKESPSGLTQASHFRV